MAARRLPVKASGFRALASTDNDNAAILDLIIADLATLKAGVNALDTALDTLVAKLNLDAGVTDVDYAGAAAAGTIGTLTAAASTASTIL